MANDSIVFRFGGSGVATVIAIGVVALVAVTVLTGAYFNNAISKSETYKRFARETSLLATINAVEFDKLAFRQAVSYSFDNAAADVLANGSFCSMASSGSSCGSGGCGIPAAVPTSGCVPWWKVYGTTYAPDYQTAAVGSGIANPQPNDGTFLGYLSGKFAGYFNSYSSALNGPLYCPLPPGIVDIKQPSTNIVAASIGSNGAGPLVKKTTVEAGSSVDTITVTEHNVFFTDTFGSSALGLFQFARDSFVDHDKISAMFQDQSDKMPDECKMFSIGDICVSDNALSICDPYLKSSTCAQQDSSNTNPCNFNKDGTVSPDERYNCSVQAGLLSGLTSPDNVFSAKIDYSCVQVGHSAHITGDISSVNWQDPQTDPNTVSACSAIAQYACGCAKKCDPIADSACNGCIPQSEGTYAGSCPARPSTPCPATCCASDYSCSESTSSCPPITTCTPPTCAGNIVCTNPCANIDCSLDSACSSVCCHASTDPITGRENGCAKNVWVQPTCCNQQCSTHTDPNCVPSTVHTISLTSCNSNACGLNCCVQTSSYVKDAICNIDYVGTAAAKVTVSDAVHAYPVGSAWKTLNTAFYVATGNAQGCSGTQPVEKSAAGTQSGLCCQALTTNIADSAAGCKS